MKKSLFILTLVLSTLFLNAQKIKFDGILESGFEDRIIKIKGIDESTMKFLRNSLYSNIELTGNISLFTAYTSIKTYYKPETIISYNPLQTEYKTGIRFDYKRLTIGYEHFCSHSIEGFRFSDAYDRISFRYKLF